MPGLKPGMTKLEVEMATNTTSHTQAPGAHGPGPFPPFQKETFASQLFWLALAFVVLYVLMSKVALPRVGGILADRKARIASDLAEAERARADSEAAMAAYEKSLADARARAQSIATETRDRLMGEAEGHRKTLEAKLNVQLAESEKSIAATKTSAMSNVRQVAVEAASAIVERLIGQAPAPDAVGSAVDRALKS
ncbi:MAG: F-type H+-transporting ATPase subunit b [Variibacter sp.]|nr:F-type H+-transporting ATPase subunit b [Variibacter sp.]